ncbi:MAG: ribosomal protein S18-alanine N-acetyltransferase [Oscillospiraceae bacterium]|nr:ribosomal protein S18-alanine N-acetyltransferase [Oscillospiraceae bacterium]
MEFRVVDFTPEMAPELANIERSCFSSPWSEETIISSYEFNTTFFVACFGKEIIGYGGVQSIANEGYITNIAVLPEFRNFKIGTTLFKRIIDFCTENRLYLLTLEVRKSNKTAIHLYENFGLCDVGIRKNFYTNPTEDAVIMTVNF